MPNVGDNTTSSVIWFPGEPEGKTPGGTVVQNDVTSEVTDLGGRVDNLEDTIEGFDFDATISAHEAESDPHPVYQTVAEALAQVTTGVSNHEAAADPHPTYLTSAEGDAKVTTHAAAADPHTGYQKESEKDAASGYAGLSASTLLAPAQIGSGSRDGTKYLRDDGTWQTVATGTTFVGCRALCSGSQTFTTGGSGLNQGERIICDTEVFDTDNIHSNTTGSNYYFTIPAGKGGKWGINAIINVAPDASGTYRRVQLLKNGTSISQYYVSVALPSANTNPVRYFDIVTVAAADTISLAFTHNATGTIGIDSGHIEVWYMGA